MSTRPPVLPAALSASLPDSLPDSPAAGAPVHATFRFYEELNVFVAPERRRRDSLFACATDVSVKHAIEALGVPHTEVELILVNGVSVGFERRLAAGDRVSVYPKFEAFDVSPLLRLRAQPLRITRFVADAHLGGLARLLRLAGFDTHYAGQSNDADDAGIVRLAVAEGRIVLTRDRELLKRRDVSHGCYVHALRPDAQLAEVVARLDLARRLQPFSLCLDCNAPLRPVAKAEVLARLPAGVQARHERFATCAVCRRVFWEGSHWQRLRERLAAAVAAAVAVQEPPLGAAGEPAADGGLMPAQDLSLP